MADPAHPYESLPAFAFWRSGVAEVDWEDIDLHWRPRFPIRRDTAIVTLGSCFAQHISRELQAHGFTWLEAEPASQELSEVERSALGYGTFSLRTGNIYTAALLRQWIWWATGRAAQSREVWREDGRYFDPMRPRIPANGFDTESALWGAREKTLAAIRGTLLRTDLFVFTLGLTEAWINADGTIYPMCPGTVRGRFSREEHRFHNYSEAEVRGDLADVFDALRALNPMMRFLLTVSPVPLTASASGEHVLTATTYSKSVLRAAAGRLREMRGDTDYFPSYELIAAPPSKGRFFAANQREVTPEGVRFVMRAFLDAIEGEAPRASESSPTVLPHEAAPAALPDICDEIVLESWSPPPKNAAASPEAADASRVLVIGDSQMGLLSGGLRERGVSHVGGALMHASQWHNLDFAETGGAPYFVPTLDAARQRWEEISAQFFRPAGGCIVTNIGVHARCIFMREGFMAFLQTAYGPGFDSSRIPLTDLRNYALHARRAHMSILRRFVDAGHRVIVVTDPPTIPVEATLAGYMDEVLANMFHAIGCEVFSAREWITRIGGMPEEFRSTEIDPATGELDYEHGSAAYYRELAGELVARFPLGHASQRATPRADASAPARA